MPHLTARVAPPFQSSTRWLDSRLYVDTSVPTKPVASECMAGAIIVDVHLVKKEARPMREALNEVEQCMLTIPSSSANPSRHHPFQKPNAATHTLALPSSTRSACFRSLYIKNDDN